MDYTNYVSENNEKLIDINSRGKDRNWTLKKRKSSIMADVMSLASEKSQDLARRSELMKSCCDILVFKECNVCDYKHLEHSLFCKDRFCPVCNWRRSLTNFRANKMIYDAVQAQYPNAKHYMATFTIQNTDVGELKSAITMMNRAWDRLMKRKLMKDKFNLGFLKVLEITRNGNKASAWYKTMHPHFHSILSTLEQDINIEEMTKILKEYWLHALQVQDAELYAHYKEHLQLDFQEIKNISDTDFEKNTKTHNISANAIAEISKYTMKFNTLLLKEDTKQESADFLAILSEQLKGVRNISYGGIIADIASKLNVDAFREKLELKEKNKKNNTENLCPQCLEQDIRTELQEVEYRFNKKNKDNTYRKVTKCPEIIRNNVVYIIDENTGEILSERLMKLKISDNYKHKQRDNKTEDELFDDKIKDILKQREIQFQNMKKRVLECFKEFIDDIEEVA